MVRYLPKELVERIEPEPSGETEEERELAKLPQPLRNMELLDVEKGLDYCGDAEDYLDALEIYAASVEGKARPTIKTHRQVITKTKGKTGFYGE